MTDPLLGLGDEDYFLDFTKPPRDIIVQQINHDNQCDPALTVVDLEFGTPEVIPDLNTQENTRLMVNVAKNATQNLQGEVEVTYKRVDLSKIVGTASDEFYIGDAEKISDLIQQINIRYHVAITAEDYMDAPLPDFGRNFEDILPFQIKAKRDSLVWFNKVTLYVRRGFPSA